MSGALRARTPDLLLDWSQVLTGNFIDDISGFTWELSGDFVQDDGLFGGPGAKFVGNNFAAIRGIPWSVDWTVVTFARSDPMVEWQKLWESNIAPGYGTANYNDYIGCLILPGGQYGASATNISAHLTTSSGVGATTLAHMDDFAGSASMVSVVKRGSQLNVWHNTHQSAPIAVGEVTTSSRNFVIGVEHTVKPNVFWLGAIGSVGYWRRSLSGSEIRAIWKEVSPSAYNIPISAQSVTANPMRYTSGYVIPPSSLRVNGMAGLGSLAGTVKIQVTPTTKTPARRKVRILDTETGLLLYETWSEERTGYWRVDGLALNRFYTVLSHDHLRDYNAVTADYRLAEIMS